MARHALLFDLDGTLLDSDPIHVAVFRDLFAERGIEIDEEFYFANVHGRLNVDVFAEFLPDEPDPNALSERKEAEFRRRLPRPMPPLAGAEAVIDRAASMDLPLAVVTNAMRANAEAMLEATGLAARFATLVIGEECARGKPHPDPYLAALDALGADAGASLVFEDSPSGIRAAVAAGIPTIGVRSSRDAAALHAAGAEATIGDFTDPALPGLLARLKGAAA